MIVCDCLPEEIFRGKFSLAMKINGNTTRKVAVRFPDTLHAAATAENKQTDKQNIFCRQCIQPRPIHSNVGFNGVVGNISLASLPKTTKSTKRFCRKRKTRGLSFLSLCSIQSFLIQKSTSQIIQSTWSS